MVYAKSKNETTFTVVPKRLADSFNNGGQLGSDMVVINTKTLIVRVNLTVVFAVIPFLPRTAPGAGLIRTTVRVICTPFN